MAAIFSSDRSCPSQEETSEREVSWRDMIRGSSRRSSGVMASFSASGESLRKMCIRDRMVTVRDTDLEEFSLNEEIRNLPGTGSSVVYQKAEAVCSVPEAEISDEAGALGDLELLTENAVSLSDGVYEIKAPIVIMDDDSFVEYCVQNNVETCLLYTSNRSKRWGRSSGQNPSPSSRTVISTYRGFHA